MKITGKYNQTYFQTTLATNKSLKEHGYTGTLPIVVKGRTKRIAMKNFVRRFGQYWTIMGLTNEGEFLTFASKKNVASYLGSEFYASHR